MKKIIPVVVAIVLSNSASASSVSYTSRVAFENALATFTVDNFDGIAQGSNASYARTDFTFTTLSGNGSYGCVNHVGCGDNSSKGFDYAYLWNYAGEDVFSFNSAVNGIGFDYDNPVGYSSSTPVLEGFNIGTQSGFFGVISDVAQTRFTFNQSGLFLLIDNITYGAVSNVPVPTAVWLFGSGLLGLIGMRKKSEK